MYGGDLGQHLHEKFSITSWTKIRVVSCAPHTSLDEINGSVVKSARGGLVRGSDPPLVYSSTAGRVWRAPTGLLLKIYLAAGVWKAETKNLHRLSTGKKYNFFVDLTEDHRRTQSTSHALGH